MIVELAAEEWVQEWVQGQVEEQLLAEEQAQLQVGPTQQLQD